MNLRFLRIEAFAAGVVLTAGAAAQINVGSDGSDGAFSPTSNVEVDLGAALTGNWTMPGAGNGVYDPSQWAVVFKYTNITIPSGVRVTFKNNRTNAPVVWLANGNVSISGEINLRGKMRDANGKPGEPGPGGFRSEHSNFFLPLGSFSGPTSQGLTTYSNEAIFPLIGGQEFGSESGGGAILIACNNTLQFSAGSNIQTKAGAFRLVADRIQGTFSGASAFRSRLEANSQALLIGGFTLSSVAIPIGTVRIFPDNTQPFVQILEIGGNTVPTDPTGDIGKDPDLVLSPGTQQIRLVTRNVPPSWRVRVRVAFVSGPEELVQATLVGPTANPGELIWQGSFTPRQGSMQMTPRASVN